MQTRPGPARERHLDATGEHSKHSKGLVSGKVSFGRERFFDVAPSIPTSCLRV